jgi:hypothetical protein
MEEWKNKKENDKPEHSPFILDIEMISFPHLLTTLFGGNQGLMSIQETQEEACVKESES